MDKEKKDYNFNTDITVGEIGEGVIKRDLMSVGGTCIYENKDINFDLVMLFSNTGKVATYEIKTDVYCKPDKDTGNMFIEFECRGKDSGVMASKAEWFVTYYPFLKQAWYISMEDLRNLIYYNNFRKTSFSGDIGSNTKGYLIPRNDYKHLFKVRTITEDFVMKR